MLFSIPSTRQIWHQQTPPLPIKEKLLLKGQCCSNISDIQRDVTELLKVVSLQDFQCALKDLYE